VRIEDLPHDLAESVAASLARAIVNAIRRDLAGPEKRKTPAGPDSAAPVDVHDERHRHERVHEEVAALGEQVDLTR
jgi:hypothetical protein